MKYLGIDYGSKKVGFAESDEEGRLAFPMMIAENNKNLLQDTVEIIRALNIKVVVIGESVDSNGKENLIQKEIKSFAEKIKEKTSVEIVFEKEWFSSFEARKQPEKKHQVDDAAAALILQRYLDKINPKKFSEEEIAEEDEAEYND